MVLCGHRKQNWGQWAEDKKTIPPQDTKPAPQTNVLQPRSVLFPSTLVRFSNLGDGAGRGGTGGAFYPETRQLVQQVPWTMTAISLLIEPSWLVAVQQ